MSKIEKALLFEKWHIKVASCCEHCKTNCAHKTHEEYAFFSGMQAAEDASTETIADLQIQVGTYRSALLDIGRDDIVSGIESA